MGSLEGPPPTFPTINISPFLPSSPSTPPTDTKTLQRTATALSSACTSPGFFYLTHHNLPRALTDRVLALAREFFLHNSEVEKSKLKRKDVGVGNGDGARGYQVIGDNVTEGKRDWHEALDYYRPIKDGEPFTESTGRNQGGREPPFELLHGEPFIESTGRSEGGREPPFELLQGMNQWPSYPGFRDTYEDYIDKMLELGTAVVKAMGMAMGEGMEDVFVKNTRESFWVMRAIGYPPLPSNREGEHGEEGGVSCGAHSDYGCVTLLLSDGTKGALQAWVEHGAQEGRWVDVDPVEGAVVVNIGDMMERWSGGKWKATRHRVVHKSPGYRVSVPFFFEPNWDAKVPGKEGEGEVVYGEYLCEKVRGNF